MLRDPEGYLFIRFGSHRAREYGLRAIERKPIAYFSLRRATGPGGCYRVTVPEAQAIRAYSRHARYTVLRGPFGDLSPCWKFD